VERSAKKAGIVAAGVIQRPIAAQQWRQLWDELGIPGDEFIRTTDERHHRTVQWLFKRMRRDKWVGIEKGHYTWAVLRGIDNAYVVDAGPGRSLSRLLMRPTENRSTRR